jgi:hypothetical protein
LWLIRSLNYWTMLLCSGKIILGRQFFRYPTWRRLLPICGTPTRLPMGRVILNLTLCCTC